MDYKRNKTMQTILFTVNGFNLFLLMNIAMQSSSMCTVKSITLSQTPALSAEEGDTDTIVYLSL